MSELPWMQIAKSYLGLTEGPGAANDPKVIELFKLAGHPEIRADSVPWCAAGVSAVLQQAKLKNPRSLWALDYAKWGQALDRPYYGCVAVKKRKAPDGKIAGHVGFCVGANKTQIVLLGFNQGDAVSIAAFPREQFVAFRWPSEIPIPAHPIDLPTNVAGARSNMSEA